MGKYGSGIMDKAAKGLAGRKKYLDGAIDSMSADNSGTTVPKAPTQPERKPKKRKVPIKRDGNSFSHGYNK